MTDRRKRQGRTNPRARGTNPRAAGTNPRAGRSTFDAAYARRIVGRALDHMRAHERACEACGGRGTFSPWSCHCAPVLFVEAVAYCAGEGLDT